MGAMKRACQCDVFVRVPCLKLLQSRCRFQHASWPWVNVSPLHPCLAGFGGVSSAPSAVRLAPKGWRIWAPWCLDVKGLGATTSSLSWEKGLMHVPTFAHMHANIHTHDACACVDAHLLQCSRVSKSQDHQNMATRQPNMATHIKQFLRQQPQHGHKTTK